MPRVERVVGLLRLVLWQRLTGAKFPTYASRRLWAIIFGAAVIMAGCTVRYQPLGEDEALCQPWRSAATLEPTQIRSVAFLDSCPCDGCRQRSVGTAGQDLGCCR